MAAEYRRSHVRAEGGIARVTIDPPSGEPARRCDARRPGTARRRARGEDPEASDSVVVVRSADPEFFIAHADLDLIKALPRDPRP